NRSQIRQTKQRAVVLADVPARFLLQKFDAETNSPLNHRNLAGTGFENAHLRAQPQPSRLRHDQHLSVGVVEKAIRHRRVGNVNVNRNARMGMRVAVASHRNQTVNEVGVLRGSRDRNWTPAQLVRRRRHLVERRAAQPSPLDRLKRLMRHFLRSILSARQYAFHRLAGELVAESRLVTQAALRWHLRSYVRRSSDGHSRLSESLTKLVPNRFEGAWLQPCR